MAHEVAKEVEVAAPVEKRRMQVFVRGCRGDSDLMVVQVEEGDTVSSIKERVEKQCGIDERRQVMMYKGKVLDDKHALDEYNLCDEATVDMHHEMKGGLCKSEACCMFPEGACWLICCRCSGCMWNSTWGFLLGDCCGRECYYRKCTVMDAFCCCLACLCS